MAGMYNNCKLTIEPPEMKQEGLLQKARRADINTVWWLGNIIAGWTTYGTDKNFPGSSWAWRTPTLVQCVMPSIVMMLVLFFPGK